jgi:iron(III) transport system ATP-binding protein
MSSLTLDRLTIHFGAVEAVSNVSFSVAEGEMVSLLGPSGCGKSTILRVIAGLFQPSSGTVRVGSQVVNDLARGIFVPPEQRQLGMVFQSYAIWPHMTVLDNVAYALEGRRMHKAERKRLAMEALDTVQLSHLADRPAPRLSGGQQQRVAIARSLVNRPALILADEPTGNLDSRTSVEVMEIFQKLNRTRGITLVLVTHEPDIAEYADRVVVFKDGRIKEDYKIENPRDASEELKLLPDVEQD